MIDELKKVLDALNQIETKGTTNAFLIAFCAQTIQKIISDNEKKAVGEEMNG